MKSKPNELQIQYEQNAYATAETKSDAEPYPNAKVFVTFSVFGGGLGGLLIILVAAIISLDLRPLLLVIYAIPVGILIGTIPAIITGFVITKLKLRLLSIQDYFKVALVGFFVTAVLSSFLLFSTHDGVEAVLGLSITGAVSSMILGHLSLPKYKENKT